MWFCFCVTPRRIAYYPWGVMHPSLGTTELRHYCTLSWLFSRLLVWPSSLLLNKALLLLHFSRRFWIFSWSRWTISTNDITLPGVFPLWKAQGFRQRILRIFTRDAGVASLRDPWARILTNARTVAGFHRSPRLKQIQVSSSCRYTQTPAFFQQLQTKTVKTNCSLDNKFTLKLLYTLPQK